MDPTLRMVLGIAMRWLHISSVITILGGFVFARFALTPALASTEVVSRFRGLLYTAIVAVLVSGIYNYLTKSSYPPGYHMWIGIKFLLVLHVFAVSILYTLANVSEAKRSRLATGIVVSGFVIVLISGYLRWISLNPPL